jgi:uncharacterized protein (DUF1501 family)
MRKPNLPTPTAFTRRNVLRLAAATGGISLLDRLMPLRVSHAAPTDPAPIFLWLTFTGAWDQLLVLDPRPNNVARYRTASATALSTLSGIRPAYDMVQDPVIEALMAANPSGVRKRGNLEYGPAVPDSLFEGNNYKDFAIVRGLNMDTVAHEVGRRYMLTGKFPRGSAASGSSLATLVAAQASVPSIMQHVVFNAETYNEGLPAFASGTRTTPTTLRGLLTIGGTNYGPGEREALRAYQSAPPSCEESRANHDQLLTRMRENNVRAHELVGSNVRDDFDFLSASPTAEQDAMRKRFGVTAATVSGPRGRMLAVAQLLANNLTTSVSAALHDNVDDHDDWHVDHATKLREGLEAMNALIDYLRETLDGNGKPLWSRTTLLLSSDFARTPLLNPRDGRDHHITNSALIAGPGIQGNQVFGATSDDGMLKQKISVTTGAVSSAGIYVRPTDLAATLLQSMQIGLEPISNQNPVILTKLLKT